MAIRPSPITPAAWADLTAELARWADAGRCVRLWWRDDDAVRPDPRIDRLIARGGGAVFPALAVIPAPVDVALDVAGLRRALPAQVPVLQHGFGHRDRGGSGGKKSEFPDTLDPAAAMRDIQTGWACLQPFGARLRRVFVPPWNRLSDAAASGLKGLGFRALSAFAGRPDKPSPVAPGGPTRLDTHADVTDWHAAGGARGLDDGLILGALVAWLAAIRLDGGDGPVGLLTHHQVLDDAGDRFLGRLFDMTLGQAGCAWVDPTADLNRPTAGEEAVA